ncbi:MAG: (2Fe-2S)-binding protein [Deltaproteobacteria bacterium]|nr:(2Fe-2S)-binding protein [Deltaproteobacteria bacterium]
MISLNVNGKVYNVDVPPDTPLVWVLRDHLKLMGTKYACGVGECGACTVHVDGVAKRSCVIPVGDVHGKKIVTIEGLPKNHPVKRAWIMEQVPQCGFCQPGTIMQVAYLIAKTPNPDPEKVLKEMDDIICRCGTYPRMKKAIKKAIELSKKGVKK